MKYGLMVVWATNIMMELHAIFHGLRHLQAWNIRKACCYSDSIVTIKLIYADGDGEYIFGLL